MAAVMEWYLMMALVRHQVVLRVVVSEPARNDLVPKAITTEIEGVIAMEIVAGGVIANTAMVETVIGIGVAIGTEIDTMSRALVGGTSDTKNAIEIETVAEIETEIEAVAADKRMDAKRWWQGSYWHLSNT